MHFTIRPARRDEIVWVNSKYDEVGFVHSSVDKELIAIAEEGDVKLGLGRLVRVDGLHCELGGMYVFDNARGKGIARSLVNYLIDHRPPNNKVYCIPFKHLADFYQSCGFVPVDSFSEVPQAVVEKYRWCDKTYSHGSLLYVLEP